jgi:hypothetical protein
MNNNWFEIFEINEGLAAAGRIPSVTRLGERISASEIALLLSCGIAAAISSGLLHRGLQIPGSSIVFSMIPMALGFALAPRRYAGFIMGAGAMGAAFIINQTGLARVGAGAFVSLCLIGPVLDLSVAKAREGWRLYSGLILAGIITNLLALGSRAVTKFFALDLGTRPFSSWWAPAIVTYMLSGAIAGLIAALCFFHFRKQRSDSNNPGTAL